jgi:hypothetical protein
MNIMDNKSIATRDHHYIYKGVRYETRLECKEGIAREGGLEKINTTFFNNLLALGIIQKFVKN